MLLHCFHLFLRHNEYVAMLYDFDTKTDYKLFSGHGENSTMFEERAHNPYMKYAWEHFAGEE